MIAKACGAGRLARTLSLPFSLCPSLRLALKKPATLNPATCKEQDATSNLQELQGTLASGEDPAPTHTLIAACGPRGESRHCEIIKVCCFRPLRLSYFALRWEKSIAIESEQSGPFSFLPWSSVDDFIFCHQKGLRKKVVNTFILTWTWLTTAHCYFPSRGTHTQMNLNSCSSC